ncbi:hypothetical protein NHH88_24415 [Oxalobacteraceae bacterium OTU3CAMAD1]|nr:hypothetical protein NHH88_24415 [Oxalobacteraceae bacterium OTU3CAMAD1]
MSKNKDRNILEAAAEVVEAGFDQLITNPLLKDIPFVGTALKLAKGSYDLRARIFQAKLEKFLAEPSLRSSRDARLIRARLNNDNQAQDIGATLFLIIEKVTDMKKPELLAKIFAAYLDEKIDAPIFFMLGHAIDQSHLIDLQIFLELVARPEESSWQQRLTSSGLMTSLVVTVGGAHSYNAYSVAALGQQFADAVKYADQITGS